MTCNVILTDKKKYTLCKISLLLPTEKHFCSFSTIIVTKIFLQVVSFKVCLISFLNKSIKLPNLGNNELVSIRPAPKCLHVKSLHTKASRCLNVSAQNHSR